MIRFLLTPATIYVDPAGTSVLMQILAPLFVLLSVFGGHLKKRLATIFRRRGQRRSGENV